MIKKITNPKPALPRDEFSNLELKIIYSFDLISPSFLSRGGTTSSVMAPWMKLVVKDRNKETTNSR